MESFHRRLRLLGVVSLLAVAVPIGASSVVTPTAKAAGSVSLLSLGQSVSTNYPLGGLTAADLTSSEFAPSGTDSDPGKTFATKVNRTLGASKGQGHREASAGEAKSNPAMTQSFDGLTAFQERYAQPGGNFTFEPPDQALCAGNGFVVDGVNDATSIYSQATGARIAGPTTLNAFLGFPQELNRSTGVFGPETTDPVCLFDSATQRFFFVVLTLNISTTGRWHGGNELDIAVSKTSDPTQGWNVHRLNVTNDGASGCPCLGDYPHIGADSNGFYITTDDFPLTTNGFNGAQVYAFSKPGLVDGTATTGWRFDTTGMVAGDGGYAVIPASAQSGDYESAVGGTQYFLSSTLDNCTPCTTSDNRVAVWALTHTSNLLGSNAPTLNTTLVSVSSYGEPPLATQKSGDHPYGQPAGVGPIATNDAGNKTSYFANGKLWGAFNTGVTANGINEAGIAYYVIKPDVSSGSLNAKLAIEGTLAADNGNLVFPAIGVTPSGRGVMSYTLTGPNNFPSAAYSSLDAKIGAGPITVAQAGAGPSDGFTEYGSRPRWGDYGATAVDGTNVWVASEYIGQTCASAQYSTDFTCGHTRALAANWATRITELNLQP